MIICESASKLRSSPKKCHLAPFEDCEALYDAASPSDFSLDLPQEPLPRLRSHDQHVLYVWWPWTTSVHTEGKTMMFTGKRTNDGGAGLRAGMTR